MREPPGEAGGQHRQQDPARVEAAGGGGDQADADHAVAEQLGELLGQRDDGHAAHRVPDQHHVAVGDHRVDHLLEVAPQLVDVGVLAAGAARAAVGALVVVDGADQSAVGRPLEVPAVQVEAEAVGEDHGDLGLVEHLRQSPLDAAVGWLDLVDLDVEVDAVVGDHRHRRRSQRAELDRPRRRDGRSRAAAGRSRSRCRRRRHRGRRRRHRRPGDARSFGASLST